MSGTSLSKSSLLSFSFSRHSLPFRDLKRGKVGPSFLYYSHLNSLLPSVRLNSAELPRACLILARTTLLPRISSVLREGVARLLPLLLPQELKFLLLLSNESKCRRGRRRISYNIGCLDRICIVQVRPLLVTRLRKELSLISDPRLLIICSFPTLLSFRSPLNAVEKQ
jgi:hypothetical protein